MIYLITFIGIRHRAWLKHNKIIEQVTKIYQCIRKVKILIIKLI